jgi:hypothetical protein
MRVLCESNSAQVLSAKHFAIGFTSFSEFDLAQGKEYVVYGIMLSKEVLSYLIVGEGLFPHWYPAELFKVTRNDLPSDWYFTYLREDEGFVVNAIWGYEELVETEDHFDGLSNLNKPDLEVFLGRKQQIDEAS